MGTTKILYKDYEGTISKQGKYYVAPIPNVTPIVTSAPGKYNIWRRMLLSIGKFYRTRELKNPGKTQYKVIYTESAFNKLLTFLKTLPQNTYVGTDIEATGLDPRKEEILTIGFSHAKNKVYVISKKMLYRIQEIFDLENFRFVWVNGKFDTKFLTYKGFNIDWSRQEDVMLMHYALDETSGIHGLEFMAKYLLNADAYKAEADKFIKQQGGLSNATEDVWYKRVAIDCDYTLQLFNHISPFIFNDTNLNNLYTKILIPGAAFLGTVENRGLPVDEEFLTTYKDFLVSEITKAEDEMQILSADVWDSKLYMEQTNAKSCHGTERYPEGFNYASVNQVKWLFYSRLGLKPKKGGKSTDEDTLMSIPGEVPIVELLLKLRKLTKEYSTYVEGYLDGITEKKRVHTSFLMHATATGRLSSKGPNIQNIKKSLKKMVKAPDGYVIIEADYSAAELRTMAYISKSDIMAQIFIEGRDLHQEMADKIGIQRQQAKTLNFGIPFGLTGQNISKQFNISLDAAEKLRNDWLNAVPKVKEYLQKAGEDLCSGKDLVTPFGRHKRPGYISSKTRGEAINEAKNFRIQSLASDLDLLSAIEADRQLLEWGAEIVNLVHDSIIIVCPADWKTIKKVAEYINLVMSRQAKKQLGTDIKFNVEVEVGKNWKEKTVIIESTSMKTTWETLEEFKLDKPDEKVLQYIYNN